MRLPQSLISSPLFQYHRVSDLLAALDGEIDDEEVSEIQRLSNLGLPPITSANCLAAIFGVNPKFIWSLCNRRSRHYRHFSIPKGRGMREIHAPRVGLKLIQKWLSVRLSQFWGEREGVYGFVTGRSHVDAAAQHCGSDWVLSCDIENFFPSTTELFVIQSLEAIGYHHSSAALIASLTCYQGGLAQGSPLSPILSNICFNFLDIKFLVLRDSISGVYTRYADDIVFSGRGGFPEGLLEQIRNCFKGTPWCLADNKNYKAIRPCRLKVHGLLVDGDKPRLTKGYRNKIRAYSYLVDNKKITKHESIILGHLTYAEFVSDYNK